jgi:parallel beta-helix repeat protein
MESTKLTAGSDRLSAGERKRTRRIDPLVALAIALTVIALAALVLSSLVSTSRAAGNSLACGGVVTQDVTLTHDIVGCTLGGLTVARSGVTIDLNGHSIMGLGEGDGIALVGVRDVTILGGSIVGFEFGMHLFGATGAQVWDTRFVQNSDASVMAVNSSYNKFRRVTMTENGDGGFRMSASSNNRIAGSTISGASDSGVNLEELSSNNRIVRNKITLAGEGVKVDSGTGNRIFRNTLSFNGGHGVEVAEASFNTRINENQANRNGGDGIFIEGVGTQVNRNRVGCNGGLGIYVATFAVGQDNWAGGNGDTAGCKGVVCRFSLGCGME